MPDDIIEDLKPEEIKEITSPKEVFQKFQEDTEQTLSALRTDLSLLETRLGQREEKDEGARRGEDEEYDDQPVIEGSDVFPDANCTAASLEKKTFSTSWRTDASALHNDELMLYDFWSPTPVTPAADDYVLVRREGSLNSVSLVYSTVAALVGPGGTVTPDANTAVHDATEMHSIQFRDDGAHVGELELHDFAAAVDAWTHNPATTLFTFRDANASPIQLKYASPDSVGDALDRGYTLGGIVGNHPFKMTISQDRLSLVIRPGKWTRHGTETAYAGATVAAASLTEGTNWFYLVLSGNNPPYNPTTLTLSYQSSQNTDPDLYNTRCCVGIVVKGVTTLTSVTQYLTTDIDDVAVIPDADAGTRDTIQWRTGPLNRLGELQLYGIESVNASIGNVWVPFFLPASGAWNTLVGSLAWTMPDHNQTASYRDSIEMNGVGGSTNLQIYNFYDPASEAPGSNDLALMRIAEDGGFHVGYVGSSNFVTWLGGPWSADPHYHDARYWRLGGDYTNQFGGTVSADGTINTTAIDIPNYRLVVGNAAATANWRVDWKKQYLYGVWSAGEGELFYVTLGGATESIHAYGNATIDGNLDIDGVYKVDTVQVVGAQQSVGAGLANATAGDTYGANEKTMLQNAYNRVQTLETALRTHGLIVT